jgi:hypothetical protein
LKYKNGKVMSETNRRAKLIDNIGISDLKLKISGPISHPTSQFNQLVLQSIQETRIRRGQNVLGARMPDHKTIQSIIDDNNDMMKKN